MMFPERYQKILHDAQRRADAQAFKKQANCKHQKVVEAPYSPDSWCAYARPDFRVCLQCGFAEEGWGCGYQILKGRREEVGTRSRDEASRVRVGRMHPNSHFVRREECRDRLTLYRRALRESFPTAALENESRDPKNVACDEMKS